VVGAVAVVWAEETTMTTAVVGEEDQLLGHVPHDVIWALIRPHFPLKMIGPVVILVVVVVGLVVGPVAITPAAQPQQQQLQQVQRI
jgi:hypothetical protein